MNKYTITAAGALGADTKWKAARGFQVLGYGNTREEAEAIIAADQARRDARKAEIEARKAGYEAQGLTLVLSTHGMTRAERMARKARWNVLDGEAVVASYDRFEDVPAAEPVAVEAEAEAVEVVEQAAPAAPTAVEAPVRGTATDAQVARIMHLIADGAHEEGGFYAGPTTRAEIEGMSCDEASLYIDSLTGNY